MIKTTMVLVMICCVCIVKGQFTHSKNGRISLEDFLDTYAKHVVYRGGIVKKFGDSVDVKNIPKDMDSALVFVFNNQRYLTLEFKGRKIISVIRKKGDKNLSFLSPAGCLSIRGIVKISEGEDLSGTSLTIKGTKKGTITNNEGKFSINICRGEKLVISHIGHKPQEITWKEATFITVQLEKEILENEPAVVKGYVEDQLKTISPPRKIKLELPINSNLLENYRGHFTSTIITPTSGIPGATQLVNIRGYSSIGQLGGWNNRPANDPLIIVNGVPMPTLLRPLNQLISMAGDPRGAGTTAGGLHPLFTIPALDIESFQVLKDAATTAIYGSRGANGVIILRTKKALDTIPTLTYLTSKGWGRITTAINMMNTRQYLDMRYQAYQNDALDWTSSATANDLKQLDTTRNNDWKKWLLGGTASIIDHYLAYTKSNKMISYFFSGGYHNETTVLPGDVYGKRISISSDVSYRSKNKRVVVGLSAFHVGTTNKWITDNAMKIIQLITHAPNLYKENGTLNWEESGTIFLNPESFFQNTLFVKNNNTLVHTHSIFNFTNQITGEISLGYNRMATNEEARFPKSGQNPAYQPTGALTIADNNFDTWNVEPQLQYTYNTGNSLRIQTIIGASWLSQINKRSTHEFRGYTNDEQLGVPGRHSDSIFNSDKSKYNYLSGFTRILVSLKNKLQFNFTFRLDESSRFGKNARLAKLGSIGGGWIIKKTDASSTILNYVKLRANVGITGNDQIGDYGYLNDYSLYTGAQYQGQPALRPSGLANPDYRWEMSRKMDMAIETSFFNGCVDVMLLFYHNNTTDQLIIQPLPSQTGFTSIANNFPAEVKNSGVEVEVGIHKAWKNIFYNGKFTFSSFSNKLLKFPNLQDFGYNLVVGESLTVEKGYKFGGVDPASGMYTIKDSAEPQVIGHHDPVILAGLVQSLKFGSFQLQGTIEFQIKKATHFMAYIYNTLPPGRRSEILYMNQPAALANNWKKTGDQARWQKFSTRSNGQINNAIRNYTNSNETLVNASFLLLKNIQLTYDLTKGFITKCKIKKIKLFVNGENLFMLTPYEEVDPQIANPFVLPPLKVITAGFSITI